MDKVFDTLFMATVSQEGCVAVLNARAHPALRQGWAVAQDFRPYAEALEWSGFAVNAEMEDGVFDTVFVHAPKNAIEAQHLMARGVRLLARGGVLVCAAANDAGGKRLQGWMEALGFLDVQTLSKHKARVVWGAAHDLNVAAVEAAYEDGLQRHVEETGFISQPGIFGWDKIDAGSRLLVEVLAGDLAGTGADFGSGYGFLTRAMLQNCAEIRKIYCIDADRRALAACSKNCDDDRVECLWIDLTKPVKGFKNLDFVVMNPPFHEGRASDSAIGAAFIETAWNSLRSGGKLLMVANAHLPYESGLQARFSSVQKVCQRDGFKVFAAIK